MITEHKSPYLSRGGTIKVGYAGDFSFVIVEVATNKWWSLSSSWSVILGLYPPD